jgi:parvulin-like peptidyl-prolyl isomerase
MSLNTFRNGLENITSTTVGKWAMIGVGALLAFGLVAAGWSNFRNPMGGNAPATRSGEDVVATVNGDPITRADYNAELSSFQSQLQQYGRNIGIAETPLLDDTALEQVINAKLQLQQAKTMNVAVSDADIQKKREEIVNLSGLRPKLSLPPTASLADVDAALTKAGDQTVEQKLPDDTLRQMILLGDPQSGQPGKLQQAFANTIVVDDNSARQFYTKYHTRHILIDNKKRSDVQAKAQALEILAKAKAPGADFAALAKQYSDDPGTKIKGGDDGFIDENTQYIPEFKKAAFSLKPGEVTPDPVASAQYGYFIIKLDEVKVALPPDFEKNKAKYLAQIKQQRAGTKYQELMKSLQDSAKIDVKDPALAGDRAFAKAGQLGPQAQPKYQEALADYQKALQGNPPALEKATINAALAQVYQNLRQTPQAIAAYEAALKSRDDGSIEMTLGKLYLDNKDNAHAVAHFQQASQLAWNDQSTHVQLISDFRQAGRADLSTKEIDWLKAHPAPSAPSPMSGAPGGVPSGTPAGSVHVTVPPSAKPAPKPAH